MISQAPRKSRGPLKAVILDWAGTTVDYGCLAPVEAFRATFKAQGIEITTAEARAPMGLNKRDHIKAITASDRVASLWRGKFGHDTTEEEIDAMYAAFVPFQLACIRDYAQLIPGTLETIAYFRHRGLKIGSTTGYSREMMALLLPEAEKQGYKPDAVACASDVALGRPSPFLVFVNAMKLGVYPLAQAVKIGDTVADIEEGVNAGMWTIGLTRCGNELGLSQREADQLPHLELSERLSAAERRMNAAGAHYVVPSIADTIPLIDDINARLSSGESP